MVISWRWVVISPGHHAISSGRRWSIWISFTGHGRSAHWS
uniref:Uncharacterized protein n=1 Tax=Anguilla anguilla TaxID=7936 RepID=A0A0E9XMF0_ANGAN